jgi:hypothetical protein
MCLSSLTWTPIQAVVFPIFSSVSLALLVGIPSSLISCPRLSSTRAHHHICTCEDSDPILCPFPLFHLKDPKATTLGAWTRPSVVHCHAVALCALQLFLTSLKPKSGYLAPRLEHYTSQASLPHRGGHPSLCTRWRSHMNQQTGHQFPPTTRKRWCLVLHPIKGLQRPERLCRHCQEHTNWT